MADGNRIAIGRADSKITVRWRGSIVAETSNALELREGSYPPVLYIPRSDANMAFFERTTRETTCPFKGKANYFSLRSDGATDDNCVWTYETPKADVTEIAGHLAFYPDKVDIVRG